MKTKLDDFFDWLSYFFLAAAMIVFGFGIKIGIGIMGAILYFYVMRGNNESIM